MNIGGAASPGTLNNVSRGDHLHGPDPRTAANASQAATNKVQIAGNETNIQVNKNDITALSNVVNELPTPTNTNKGRPLIINAAGDGYDAEAPSDLVESGLPSLTGQKGKVLTVNSSSNGLEWTAKGGGGDTGAGIWTLIGSVSKASGFTLTGSAKGYGTMTAKFASLLTLLKEGKLFAGVLEVPGQTNVTQNFSGVRYIKVPSAATTYNIGLVLENYSAVIGVDIYRASTSDNLTIDMAYALDPLSGGSTQLSLDSNSTFSIYYFQPGSGGGGGTTNISYAGAASDLALGTTESGGTENAVSRGDHVHGFDTDFSSSVSSSDFGDSGTGGSASTVSRGDHQHGFASYSTATTPPPAADDATGSAGTETTKFSRGRP